MRVFVAAHQTVDDDIEVVLGDQALLYGAALPGDVLEGVHPLGRHEGPIAQVAVHRGNVFLRDAEQVIRVGGQPQPCLRVALERTCYTGDDQKAQYYRCVPHPYLLSLSSPSTQLIRLLLRSYLMGITSFFDR